MEDIRSHILFKKYKKVQELCLPLVRFNIHGFIYMRHYPDGRFIDLSNQLDWASFFLNKYINEKYTEGEIEHQMLQEEGTLFWSTEPDNIAWKEGAEIFGFGNGISIFKKRENYNEVFCFYGKISDFFLNKIYAQSFHVFERFSKYFVENMSSEILSAYEKNDFLITPKKYSLNNWKILSKNQEEIFIQELRKSTKETTLSSREKECILLFSLGKTAKEIARIINISPRTIEVHLANARKKMGCKNFRELYRFFSNEILKESL